jgi:monoamine oxidase
MFWDWQPKHHPYIGGGYCSPRVHCPIHSGDILSRPHGPSMFFVGEATNDLPGATAHAALETGLRAAAQVHAALAEKKKTKEEEEELPSLPPQQQQQ